MVINKNRGLPQSYIFVFYHPPLNRLCGAPRRAAEPADPSGEVPADPVAPPAVHPVPAPPEEEAGEEAEAVRAMAPEEAAGRERAQLGGGGIPPAALLRHRQGGQG